MVIPELPTTYKFIELIKFLSWNLRIVYMIRKYNIDCIIKAHPYYGLQSKVDLTSQEVQRLDMY